MAERDRCFLSLAKIYLPELGAEAVTNLEGHLPRIHDNARRALDLKEASQGELTRQVDGNRELEKHLESALEDVTRNLEIQVGERQRLTAEVRDSLTRDSAYLELMQQAQSASRHLRLYKRRLDTARAEKDDKAPGYDQNPLFAYLRNRHFGTDSYRSNPITRRLDDRAATLVDYEKQERNYEALHRTHQALLDDVENRTRALKEQTDRLYAIEQEHSNRLGLTPVLEEGRKLYQQRTELVAKIERANTEHEELTARQASLENTRGTYYARVLEESAKFLEGRDVDNLRAIARSTTTPADDGLVERIHQLASTLAEARRQIEHLGTRRQFLEGRLTDFRRIGQRFRSLDYDASNSRFPSTLDLDHLLDSLARGHLNASQVMISISRAQHFEPDPFEYSSTWGDGDYDYDDSSPVSFGGFDSSSSGGGGSSSGGGFSTGGGF